MHKKAMFGAATALALMLSLPAASAQERAGNGMSSGSERMPARERSHRAAPRGTSTRQTTGAASQDIGGNSPRASGSQTRDRAAGANGGGTERTQAQDMQREGGPRSDTHAQSTRARHAQSNRNQKDRTQTRQSQTRGRTNASAERNAGPSRASPRHSERTAGQPARRQNGQSQRANARPESRHERSAGPQRASAERNRHEAGRQRSERVRLTERERTRISSSITRLHVRPITRVNFSVGVGVVVPASVRLEPLPTDIVAIVPEYRGYDFFVVRDQIAIVAPRTHRIVEVLPYSGEATAQAPESVGRSRSERVTLSNAQRQTVRRVVTTRETTAVAPSEEEVAIGETLPDTVVVREFPQTIYESVPTLRSYRYIVRDQDIYLVDPSSRRVIEEIQ